MPSARLNVPFVANTPPFSFSSSEAFIPPPTPATASIPLLIAIPAPATASVVPRTTSAPVPAFVRNLFPWVRLPVMVVTVLLTVSVR